jgi:hypothetical protein
MSDKKVKFYPLEHQEFLRLNKTLTQSELSVYLWLKTNDPFGDKLIEADTQKIADDLSTSRRTVQRALVKLQEVNLIELVSNKFRYRLKSKSSSKNDHSFKIDDEFKVATPKLSDDNEIALTTPRSFERYQDRSDDTHIAEVSTVSPSSSETNTGHEFQISKISKTYLDFKKTLSEEERENYLKFVQKKIESFREPINDLEAWLASQTKAGQNRWEVYFDKYQSETKARKSNSDSSSVPDQERQKAIAKYQESLKQQKSKCEKIEHGKCKEENKLESLLNNPKYQIKSIEELESQGAHKSTPKTLGRYVAEGKEKLRELRTTSYFADQAIQGGKR